MPDSRNTTPPRLERLLDTEDATLWHGDALFLLDSLPPASVDAVITDPPYSSGGFTRGDRADRTGTKYLHSATAQRLPDFTGDNKDAHSFRTWTLAWMEGAMRVLKPGGVIATFTDWRQLTETTDMLQMAGFVYRGLAVWAKPSARPQRGRFASQCEYVPWGSRGGMGDGEGRRPLPGFVQEMPPRASERRHQTEKPVGVMRWLVRVAPRGGVVLDPFSGSGTTGVAAAMEGRRFVGCEMSDAYARAAADRLREAFGAGPVSAEQPTLGGMGGREDGR